VLNIMASMSTEIAVLRALLRLSRRRSPATLEDLVTRVRGGGRGEHRSPEQHERDVQHALASLARAQLVLRQGETARLSLAGLAVAVAAVANAKAAAKAPRSITSGRASARVVPMVRRRRAA
jgi:hypothetical protein